jgi:hypothetical protein
MKEGIIPKAREIRVAASVSLAAAGFLADCVIGGQILDRQPQLQPIYGQVTPVEALELAAGIALVAVGASGLMVTNTHKK